MEKLELFEYLKSKNINFEVVNHKAANNMLEIEKENLKNKKYQAKNLFLRDDKKRNYYLVVLKGDKKLDLKEFRRRNGTRTLSFASENDLMKILKLKKGSVTPFGILNDSERIVKIYFDKDFEKDNIIGVHPNVNDATIWISFCDLLKLIKEYGNQVYVTYMK